MDNIEDAIRNIEDGGYDYLYDDKSLSYKNPERARYVKDMAAYHGMTELEYVNKEEDLDKLYNKDRNIYDIEVSDLSEFLVDEEGNPATEDAKRVYESIMEDPDPRGAYGTKINGPKDALYAVLDGYDECVWEATGYSTVKEALEQLKPFTSNPICEHTRIYYDAITNYMTQFNELCDEVGYPECKVQIEA